MQPIGTHITIEPILEQAGVDIISEKSYNMKAQVVEISPDLDVPYQPGSIIIIPVGRSLVIGGVNFLNADHVLLYK